MQYSNRVMNKLKCGQVRLYLQFLLIRLLVLCSVVGFSGCSSPKSDGDAIDRFDFDSHFAVVNGTRLHYLKASSENSPVNQKVMVLLHGFPHIGEVWYPLLEHFAEDYTIIAPDLRGYGRSAISKHSSDYAIANLVEDVHQLVLQVSPGKQIILMGHDWGGVLAWGLAQTQPQLIEKLVVVNAPQYNAFLHTLIHSKAQQEASKYIAKLDSWWVKALFWWYGPELLWRGLEQSYAEGKVESAYKNAFFEAWQDSDSADAAVTYYSQNFPDFDKINDRVFWPNKTAKANVNALLIWSSEDKAFTSDALVNTQKFATSLHTHIIETNSHTPFVTHSEEVIGIMREFLNP